MPWELGVGSWELTRRHRLFPDSKGYADIGRAIAEDDMILNFSLSARWAAAGTAPDRGGQLDGDPRGAPPARAAGDPFPVSIRVDAGDARGPLKPDLAVLRR